MDTGCREDGCGDKWPRRRQELNDCADLFNSVSNPEIVDSMRFNHLPEDDLAEYGSRSPSMETRDENYLLRKQQEGTPIVEVQEQPTASPSPDDAASKSASRGTNRHSRNSSSSSNRRRRLRSASRRSRGTAESEGIAAAASPRSASCGAQEKSQSVESPSISNEVSHRDDDESRASRVGSPSVDAEAGHDFYEDERESYDMGYQCDSVEEEEAEAGDASVALDHRSAAVGDPILQDAYDSAFERQTALAELYALQRQEGVHLSRDFTEKDSLPDIRFEIMKQLASIEQRRTVSFMKDMVKMGCHGLELFNSKMGPFLELDGWATEACRDLSKYDSAFCRLQRKYCRSSSMSPEMELIMGLGMSVGMYHFKQKMLPSLGIGSGSNGVTMSAPAQSESHGGAPQQVRGNAAPPKRAPMRRAPPSPNGSDGSEVSLL